MAEVGSGRPPRYDGGLLQSLLGPTGNVSVEKMNTFMSNKCHLVRQAGKTTLHSVLGFTKPCYKHNSGHKVKHLLLLIRKLRLRDGKGPNTGLQRVT